MSCHNNWSERISTLTVYVCIYLLQLNPFRILPSCTHGMYHTYFSIWQWMLNLGWYQIEFGYYDKLIGFDLVHLGGTTWCIYRLDGGSFKFIYLCVVIPTWIREAWKIVVSFQRWTFYIGSEKLTCTRLLQGQVPRFSHGCLKIKDSFKYLYYDSDKP